MNRPAGVKADRAYSHAALENVAEYVRQGLNFGTCEAIDSLRLFENMHEISITDARGTDIPLWSGVIDLEDSEGYTRYDAEKRRIEVLASLGTYSWIESRRPRAAFFVAHELGHCLLHTNQLLRLAQMPTKQCTVFHRGNNGHNVYEDTEWQANAFAGALLMPARGLADLKQRYGSLSAHIIQNTFQVSHEAATYRLQLFTTRGESLRA